MATTTTKTTKNKRVELREEQAFEKNNSKQASKQVSS